MKKILEDYDEYRDIIPKEVFDFIDNAPTIALCGETSDGLPLIDLRPKPDCENCDYRKFVENLIYSFMEGYEL